MLEVRLLGDMRVSLDGAVITVIPGRQRLLLARLALAEGRFVQVSQLIDDLWEDQPPDSALNALQVYVSALRKLLRPAAVRTRGRSYALDSAAVIDVVEFRQEITAGLSAASSADDKAASSWLDRGLSRWTGLPCQDLDEVGFIRAARTGLADLHLSGMEARAMVRIGQGEAREVVPELRELAEQHPYRESLYAQLILALAVSGRQVEALAAYDRIRAELAEEFGVDPGEALRSAQAAVLRNELPGPPSGRLSAQPVSRPPSNLPVALTSFVGREREMAEIIESFGGARLLTLTGTGGCGKTRLAVSVAEAVLGRYRDGVWLIELSSHTDLDGLLQAVALTLSVREAPGSGLIGTLLQHLRDQDILLVLDNCEHLLGACAEFSMRALSAGPGVRILATSRKRLGVPGEIEWPVPALQVPDLERIPPLGRLVECASVRLFTDRAKAVLPGFNLTESNAAAVAAVCARLAGIPLAVELAAARVRVLSMAQIAARLDTQLGLLSDATRYGPLRQQTLRKTMDWSFDLLTSGEQELFVRLSVFAGSFGLEAAEEMAGDDASGLDVFSGLVIHSLVVVDHDEHSARYHLLEPVRQYAAQRLTEGGDTGNVRARHAAYYLRLAEAAEDNLNGGLEQATWFHLLDLERDNLRAAVRELCQTNDIPGVARLVSALWRVFLVQGSLNEGSQLLDLALGDPSVTGLVRARALRARGVFAHELCDYDQAARSYTESLELFSSTDAKHDAAGVLANLGLLAANQFEFDRAAQFMEKSLRLRRALDDALGIALSLDNLGMLALDQGDLPRARDFLEESLEMFRLGHDMVGESVALNNLSRVAMRQGDMDGALELYHKGLDLNRELADQWSTGYCLQGLAEIAVSRAQMTDAASLLGAAAMLRERTGEVLAPADEVEYRKLLAVVKTALGTAEFQQAWSQGRAHATADPIGYGLEYISR